LAGGLSADSLFMTWPDLAAVGGGLGLMIQQVDLMYRQNIRRVFEIGPGVIPGAGASAIPGGAGVIGLDASFCDTAGGVANPLCNFRTQPTYYIISRPEGEISFGRFVGPNALSRCFYKKYGSPCSPNTMSLSGKAGCSATDASARRVTWTITGVTLTSTRLGVTGQEMVMQENLSAMFSNLNIAVEGDTVDCNTGVAQL
jgi:hypothetical protein